MVLDSNILIYAAEPTDTRCGTFVLRADAVISAISAIEVLGFPRWAAIPSADQLRLESIVDSLPTLACDANVIDQAISLRRLRKMSLGDSIVAATALVHGLPLATRNSTDFRNIDRLTVINPFD